LLLAPTLFLVASPGSAAAQGLESADVYVNIVSPLTIQKLQDLDFGSIGVGVGGGSMRVRPDGAVVTTGDLVMQGGDASPAEFQVAGYGSLTYNVSMPSQIDVSDNGGNTMTVNRFAASNGGTGRLVGGVDTFTVGATLRVNPAQPPGEYEGTFDVTVAYQ